MPNNLVNQVAATVKGGFFGQYSTSYSGIKTDGGGLRRKVAMTLNKKQLRGMREMMATLNGAAAGSAASAVNGRVEANEELGGVRTIESETLVNENSAAADVTQINADFLTFGSYTSSPVANGDGNPLGTR